MQAHLSSLRSAPAVENLKGDTDISRNNAADRSVRLLYKEASDRIRGLQMGSYEIMTSNLVDVLRKQRSAKGKHWVFGCLPYQQRIAKIVVDEFIQPLGDARNLLRVCSYI